MASKTTLRRLEFHPVAPERWPDFEKLFGPRGAVAGCWCMWFRLKRSEFDEKKGAGTQRMMKKLVNAGDAPGILAYDGDEPVGWCSIAPRSEFDSLNRSRTLKPVDEQPVWSIVCFFIAKGYRRSGMTRKLIEAAVEYAKAQDAKIIEAYPIEPKKDDVPVFYAYTGFASTFRKLGFKEVLRRSESRPIMRLEIGR